jgi:hypothetical protein
MPDLIPTGDNFLPTRAQRNAGRAIDRITARQTVATAEATARAQLCEDITVQAMTSASNLSAVEALLAQANPQSAARLKAIADTGALGLVEVVMKTTRAAVR